MTTAYCFDPEHVYHKQSGHPEQPARLTLVMARLRETGRLDRMLRVGLREDVDEAIGRVHPAPYSELIAAHCERGGGQLDADTFATSDSWRIARNAVGGLLEVTDVVLDGAADNGFALTRPPGHHARPFASMGFCLLANAAIAARHAQQREGVERVMIVDFDVHHGNGTQEVFESDSSVLVLSSHQDPAYPGTGALNEIGFDDATGTTLNLPYPPGTGDAALVSAYRRLVPLAAERFAPDLILVSAGFDAHFLDPLAQSNLTVGGFADLMRIILAAANEHCEGRLVALLEGGYHPPALAESVRACLTVMEDPTASVEDPFERPADMPVVDLDYRVEKLSQVIRDHLTLPLGHHDPEYDVDQQSRKGG